MPFAAHLSQAKDSDLAIDEVCRDVMNGLGNQTPDLTIVFVSHQHRPVFPVLAKRLQARLQSKVLIGCAGEAIAGCGREIEERHALCVWSAVLPGTDVVPFHLEFERTPDGVMSTGWPEATERTDIKAAVVLGEPFSTPVNVMLDRFEEDFAQVPVVGGMASGARSPGQNILMLNDQAIDHGAVGVLLCGDVDITAIVSQGCRPVGQNYIVTKARDNVVIELSGRPALVRLQEVFGVLSERDQALIQSGPHLGIAMCEYQESFDIGDFLIANVVGADQQSGAIAIGSEVRVGQTVRFHVRDAQTADEELTAMLARYRETATADAALLFSCNGRGSRLFQIGNHDAGAIHAAFGAVPLAGFFANGEFGPVGNKNHIHGYTATVVCFNKSRGAGE